MTQPPAQEVNYKETLNLPQTAFKMKAGAATREPEIEAFWEEHQVYEQMQASKDKARKFVLHDGPPYLSSDKIHIGTALNKILKDIVTRYKAQRGYYAPYVPGYDGHGLPIENAVVKNIKGGRHAVSEGELRQRCREFALKNLAGQEANFKRLGCWGDWAHPYITIQPEFEAIQIKIFGEIYEKGYVYKGLKPVYWCPCCETALADAEVEYADHTSHSIYVGFPLVAAKQPELQDARMVIWTTTPWTLPANLALSVHPDFEYALIHTDAYGKLVVAKALLEAFTQAVGLEQYNVLNTFKGQDLELSEASHPFIDRNSTVLVGHHVTLDAGTGVVHTAPGHGMEDYVIAQEYDRTQLKERPIGILSPVDSRGAFTEEAGVPKLTGVRYDQGNEQVLQILRDKNALLGHAKVSHSYPHCWRCHNPVIYRATEQWFIDVDKFRGDSLAAIDTVQWIPERGRNRIYSMVENRSDWCLSRQRVWGVPIPVFYCANEACKKELITPETIEKIYQLFKAHSSDVWWTLSAEEILGGSVACSACGGTRFTQEMDIMDVWFDSGITHTAVVEARKDQLGELPVELYLEGSDQHRGWFQSSLLTSVMLYGKAPYKSVLTHGFVLDQDGRKMSKSLGNVVDPNSVIQQYGADILRLWVASVDYTVDIRIGNAILAQLAEVYKKVRNTFRFMLGNLHDFDPQTDRVSEDQLSALDQFVLHRLQGLIERITRDFDAYEFHRYNHEIQYFCGTDLSAQYFDVAKDILYCDATGSPRRRAVQTVMYETLSALLPMLVPIMPHLAEDIWLNLPDTLKVRYNGLEEAPPVSVTMAPWPTVQSRFVNPTVAEQVDALLKLKEMVNLAIEKPRSEGQIGSSLEVDLGLEPLTPESRAFIQCFASAELAAFFITSDVQVVEAGHQYPSELREPLTYPEQFKIHVYPAQGEKCQRCWRYESSVGTFPEHPALCERCYQAVRQTVKV